MKWHLKYFILSFCIFFFQSIDQYAKTNENITTTTDLTNQFYILYQERLFWFSNNSYELRNMLLQLLYNCRSLGLNNEDYRYSELLLHLNPATTDSVKLSQYDRIYTGAAITYLKDVYQGHNIAAWLKYDEWSQRYEVGDNRYILEKLVAVRSATALQHFALSLEPNTTEYNAYKIEYQSQLAVNPAKAKQLAATLNLYRWYTHFHFTQYILVNIPSATLHLFSNDTEVLMSRIIVGKPQTPTPRFAASCKQIILYPYWNVPHSIATKELLPKFSRHPSLLASQNMQIVDANGHILDPYHITWSNFNHNGYRLRQSTGCDNSLGVIKFDLTDPLGVYLHDTNTKGLFTSTHRYYSHGCMRVEKAIELGNILLNNTLDTAFLKACYKQLEPRPIQLSNVVPVFVIYSTAHYTNDTLHYYKDVYKLF